MFGGSIMNKITKNKILLASILSSLLLSGCGDTSLHDDINEAAEEFIIEHEVKNIEGLSQETKDELIFGNPDISKYGLYDETSVKGLVVTNPNTGENSRYIMKQTHKMMFDSDNYSNNENFLADAVDASWGYLDEEAIKNNKVIVIMNTYRSVDDSASYSEKRVYYVVNENGEESLICSIDERFSAREMAIEVKNISIDGVGVSVGIYGDKDGSTIFEDEDGIVLLTDFTIPKGVYTEESLMELINAPEVETYGKTLN